MKNIINRQSFTISTSSEGTPETACPSEVCVPCFDSDGSASPKHLLQSNQLHVGSCRSSSSSSSSTTTTITTTTTNITTTTTNTTTELLTESHSDKNNGNRR
ncbi:hypothetical protein PoB_006868200 [Plakobranchus ocellatus]|uniref:Uncharacterized protein n=1 Tax=Plakobranchus ocellatus TaxID=259542 RepID=A0AAV4DD51_9GAST|nr:hypothetical protein PoB_006868200 [Plakobranchus ocellatus]